MRLYILFFIHRILLFLSLADFPFNEPVHVVGPLGATFLRQRAAHLRADPSVSRGASSSSVPPPLRVLLRLLVLLLLLMFLHRLLRMIPTLDVRWITS